MSNFANDRINREERKQRKRERQKSLSDFIYSLAKLCFGGLVIGEGVYWHNGQISWQLLIVGLVSTITLALIANNILNK